MTTKSLFIVSIFLSLFITLAAQTEKLATTDGGKRVILYSNGTWEYLKRRPASRPKVRGCTIKTGLKTQLKDKAEMFGNTITDLPRFKEYDVLEKKIVHHVKDFYFFRIRDAQLNLEGWVMADGVSLEYVDPDCYD
ncbi:MAG: hypothetical protein AAF587_00475 [Bacteroidota bacterium]